MRAAPLTGLVGAGGVNRSFLARMPKLLGTLGPVKAASFRVARRIANTLGAGYPVSDYAALEDSTLILVDVPESTLDLVIGDLAAYTPLEGSAVILCDSIRDSLWPNPLRAKGASVASLNAIPESNEQDFVAEGDPAAVAELRHLAALDKRKLIELQPASKALYFSGVHLVTNLLLPCIAGSVESLRAAGFTRSEATQVAQTLGTRTIRDYGKAGRKAWNRDMVLALRRNVEQELEIIRGADPHLADLYARGVEQALAFFEPESITMKQISMPKGGSP
jgi:predicted short-subunit dehydrogenase-like oxidoreductase (DUF2520 family)